MDNAPLKLLQVASGDLWAGAEVQFFYLCRQLFKQGIDVHTLLLNEGILADRLRLEGVPVTVFDETRLGGLQLLQKLTAHIRQLRPSVIHTHRHKENVLIGIANAITIQARSVRTVHGSNEIHEPIWKFHKHLIRVMDRFVGRYLQQAIVAVSHPLADLLAFTFEPTKIHVIENSIDIEYVELLSQLEPQFQISGTSFNIAIVGRLVSVKRHDLLIGAIAQLLPRYPTIHLYVIGDGPLCDKIDGLISRLELTGRVTCTGAVDPVYPLLVRMNLLVMPSDHEGLPMTLLEAMALRVPIVAHAVGGIVQAVDGGKLARLVEEHTEAGYARAISEVADARESARERAELGFQRVRQNYDICNKYVQYVSLYTRLLGMKGRSIG